MLRVRTDKINLVLAADASKLSILRKKAIAGMDRVGARHLNRTHHRWDAEITLGARSRADTDAFIGELRMQRIPVGRRMNRHRL